MTRITHVLCPVDFSETSRHALDQAAAIARWYGARLTVPYVFVSLPTLDLPPLVLDDKDREALLVQLRGFAAGIPSDVTLDLRVEQAEYAHDEILRQIAAGHADLLVLGTHGRSGFQRLFLGSVTEKLIRKAPCPTLVVPPRSPAVSPDAPIAFRRILCPIDFSDASLGALEYAMSLAEENDARLTVLHVIDLPPELRENALVADLDVDRVRAAAEAEARRRLRELVPEQVRTYCSVETAVVEGGVHRQVLRQAATDDSDLIVMGVHGRGAVDLLVFGSTTHHVVRSAHCPVLIVRRA
jgi:nucleotide-binding universal stress UspA family protein